MSAPVQLNPAMRIASQARSKKIASMFLMSVPSGVAWLSRTDSTTGVSVLSADPTCCGVTISLAFKSADTWASVFFMGLLQLMWLKCCVAYRHNAHYPASASAVQREKFSPLKEWRFSAISNWFSKKIKIVTNVEWFSFTQFETMTALSMRDSAVNENILIKNRANLAPYDKIA